MERGEHESASLPSLDVFPPFSLLMSVRMQVSFFIRKKGGVQGKERWGGKTKQQESRKRPKEQAFLIKCLRSVYSKFCRHVVER